VPIEQPGLAVKWFISVNRFDTLVTAIRGHMSGFAVVVEVSDQDFIVQVTDPMWVTLRAEHFDAAVYVARHQVSAAQ